MPGNSPGEAVERFLDPIKQTLSYLGSSHLQHSKHPEVNAREAASLERGEGMKVPAGGPYAPFVTLELELNYMPIHCPDDEERGPYRCRSTGYILMLRDTSGAAIFSAHWHPLQTVSPVRRPHIHVGQGRLPQIASFHIPTPRVSVEQFVTWSIASFGMQPKVDEDTWRAHLEESHALHAQWRTWSDHDESPFVEGLPPG